MLAIINSWQFNLISYLILVVVYFQFYKLAVRNATKDGAATILLQLIAGFSILLLFPFFPIVLPNDPKIYLFLLIASVFYALNDRLQTTVRKNLQVSLYSILDRFTTIFIIIFGLTVFKEPLVPTKILGAALILLGSVVALYKKGKIEFNKYVILSIIASLSFSIAVSIDIGISKHFNLPFYIMFTLIVPALILMVAEQISLKDVFSQYSKADGKYYWITGLAWGLLILFVLRAYQFGDVSIISPLSSVAVLVNVLIAYLFRGERDGKVMKILAACLTIAGVYFTVLG